MAEENIEADRFKQNIAKSDEIFDKIYLELNEFNGTLYSNLCSVINKNYHLFPLATLKAFSRFEDEEVQKYIKDYESRRNIINDKNVIGQFKKDEQITDNYNVQESKADKEFSLYTKQIKKIEAQYKPKSKFYEFVHPFFKKVFKMRNKKELKIENCNRHILHAKQLCELSPEYEAARDRLVFWEVSSDVCNVNQLANKLREFSNYVNRSKNLFYAVRSMTDGIDINNICNEAEKTARDGDGAYGKGGNKLCIFDIDNPLHKIDISAETCEPYNDNVKTKSTILYNGQVISKIKAKEIIFHSFLSPCVYTAQGFHKEIASKLYAKAPIQQKTLQRDPSEKNRAKTALESDKPVVKEEKGLSFSSKNEGLSLPKKANGKHNRLYRYLTKTRCIDSDIVRQCIKAGLIYEDVKHNAVFVGKDSDGNPAFATKRSTLTKSNFKRDVAGSRQDIGFMVDNSANKLYVCEAPIDALSIMSLMKQQGKQVEKASYLATCDIGKDVAVYTRLKENPQIKEVVLANDHDAAGFKANKKIYENLCKDFPGIKVKMLSSENGKSINNCLNRTVGDTTKTKGFETEVEM